MEKLLKRVKSLAWRGVMMGVAVAVTYYSNNIGALELSPAATVFFGLILGELSKWLNNNYNGRV